MNKHDEESLMALHNKACGHDPFAERETALRLAIREVLAEWGKWKRLHEELAHAINESLEGVRELVQRAEKAEAECERLRGLLNRTYLRNEIDAALKEKPCQS